MTKRIKRLAPKAWIVIASSYFIYFIFKSLHLVEPEKELTVNFRTFVFGLMFLQFIIPSSANLIVPMWSLSVEIFMNLIYALIGASKRHIILLGLFSFTTLSISLYIGTPINATSGWIALIRGIYGFSCGLVTKMVYDNNISISPKLSVTSIFIVILNFTLISISSNFLIFFAPSAALLILLISKIEIRNRSLKLLCSLSGNFSYGIYLWHFPVIYFVDIFLKTTYFSRTFYTFKVLELSLTLTLSIIMTKISSMILKEKVPHN